MFSLAGKKALVVGIANEESIAYGCAKAFRDQGADLAITYLNDRAERFVRPIAEKLGAEICLPLDVQRDGEFGEVFDAIRQRWGRIDVCLHSIAFCPKEDLHGRVLDCSRSGFTSAMDISVYSFIRMVRRAEHLMPNGGTCMTVSFYGSEKVVDHYNIMGPVKAALESTSRYLAAELGPKGISVHALSPGPLKTRAASGIDHFDELMARTADRTPTHHLATIEDVGAYAAFLASREAANVTGGVHMIDGGYHIVG
ncbi:enoyl-[acyl-carrier protein] reductase I [Rhodobium orientis]|uniref:Enoyl-[acyl-carrier-protein] reductase [NADH] n=1 Tax=Rhodobium orientis TaxID=34017 RepID=A0A327JTY2_9HYPH|nr:enoyl-ACP reductase FabI [Rhodobium orientis]MBB4303464.1 enoyl-[acyl-carrier protein] reductase I [Rhodobium orientis]MBK5950398.1 enoyl-[acyl-carrier-protein] reductase [Rhodobium orientis]RAI28372.1 enoyl-[acyl-carrier-protein] reductase [Rhodobium orientis]